MIVYHFYSIGVIFAFYSNGKVNDSIRDFDGIVNTAIDNVLSFVEDTQRVSYTSFSLKGLYKYIFLLTSGGKHNCGPV